MPPQPISISSEWEPRQRILQRSVGPSVQVQVDHTLAAITSDLFEIEAAP